MDREYPISDAFRSTVQNLLKAIPSDFPIPYVDDLSDDFGIEVCWVKKNRMVVCTFYDNVDESTKAYYSIQSFNPRYVEKIGNLDDNTPIEDILTFLTEYLRE